MAQFKEEMTIPKLNTTDVDSTVEMINSHPHIIQYFERIQFNTR